MRSVWAIAFLALYFSTFDSAAQNTPNQAFRVGDHRIYGKPVDNQTRCVHWNSALDIIAVKFKCCGQFYPCHSCHEEIAFHKSEVWPKEEFDEKAILCGVCATELTISEYMECNNTCPKCFSPFNPGCKNHYHLYFEVESESQKDSKSGKQFRY